MNEMKERESDETKQTSENSAADVALASAAEPRQDTSDETLGARATPEEPAKHGDEEGDGKKGKDKKAKTLDERVLSFAKWSLAGIALLALLAAFVYAISGDSEAGSEIFEFMKVGLLPLAVMILTYYFAKPGGPGRRGPGAQGADGDDAR